MAVVEKLYYHEAGSIHMDVQKKLKSCNIIFDFICIKIYIGLSVSFFLEDAAKMKCKGQVDFNFIHKY